MRISADPHDSGYDKYIEIGGRHAKITVTLDGVEQEDVITADEERGFIILPIRNNGMLTLSGDSFSLKTLTGKVEISVERRRD